MNVYAYVSANPENRIDPAGLDDVSAILYGSGVVDRMPERKANVRAPDYVRVQASLYVFSAARTLSRSGNMYVSGGVGRAYPTPKFKLQASLSVGWLNQCEEPSGSDVDDFLSGYGMAGAAGYDGIGGGVSWSPGNGTATEAGVGVGGGASPGEVAYPDGSLGGGW